MTDKELKRLSRADLIDIIYQLQQNEENLIKMNEELKASLASKEMKIKSAGSIAEAAVSVSNVFEKAQQAADIYLSELHRLNEDEEAFFKTKMDEAQAEADKIVAEGKAKANAMIAKANRTINRYLSEHPELKAAFASREGSDET